MNIIETKYMVLCTFKVNGKSGENHDTLVKHYLKTKVYILTQLIQLLLVLPSLFLSFKV